MSRRWQNSFIVHCQVCFLMAQLFMVQSDLST
jgi:hypothetical protein